MLSRPRLTLRRRRFSFRNSRAPEFRLATELMFLHRVIKKTSTMPQLPPISAFDYAAEEARRCYRFLAASSTYISTLLTPFLDAADVAAI